MSTPPMSPYPFRTSLWEGGEIPPGAGRSDPAANRERPSGGPTPPRRQSGPPPPHRLPGARGAPTPEGGMRRAKRMNAQETRVAW
eukprot:4832640-Pyramimonas_sp.AAC.1